MLPARQEDQEGGDYGSMKREDAAAAALVAGAGLVVGSRQRASSHPPLPDACHWIVCDETSRPPVDRYVLWGLQIKSESNVRVHVRTRSLHRLGETSLC